ncbi:MAG: chemotaxis protein CheA, partial [Pseudomonadota bacterium]
RLQSALETGTPQPEVRTPTPTPAVQAVTPRPKPVKKDTRVAPPKAAPSPREVVPSSPTRPTPKKAAAAAPSAHPPAGPSVAFAPEQSLPADKPHSANVAPPPPTPPAAGVELEQRNQLHDSPVVKTMRVDAAKVDSLLNRVGELVVNRSYIEQLSAELKTLQRTFKDNRDIGKREIQAIKSIALKVSEASLSLGRTATDLQEGVMKLRMLPVGQLFNRMPRLIRDLSHRVGKKVSLHVAGADTEVDKRVIEQIYNPLVHLIRNAVDHGIEDQDTRAAKDKSEEGSITLNAYSQGNLVVIDVEDDGKGIDTEAVIRKALENRLIDPAEAMTLTPDEAYNFLFIPGFSTSKTVSRTSGRGVGMDVVRKDIEKINGTVEIVSWPDKGTRISIKIPLTLAIIQTLLIRSGVHVFAVPLTQVREIIHVSPREITTIEGFEVIKFRQETILILRITDVFNLMDGGSGQEPRFVVLATAGTKTVGFLVQDLVGEQDVVIKPLAEHVFRSRGLAGSTILGNGTIALVMDVGELVEDLVAHQRQLGAQGYRGAMENDRNEIGLASELQ